MQFQAVLFDLGGTLFRYHDVREHFDEMLKELVARHGLTAPFVEIRAAYRRAMAEQMQAFHTKPYYLHRDLFSAAHAQLLGQFGVDTNDPAALYEGQIEVGMGAVRPRNGVHETLAALRDQGLHLGIVSNIDDDQFGSLWGQMGLGDYFHATTTSEQARSCKPDAEIYLHALAKAPGVEPERVLFVGDSAPHDVLGAKRLGMTTALISSKVPELAPEMTPEHVIQEIPELLDIVGR